MNFRRKLATAITGTLFLSLLLGSCTHNTDPHAVKISDAGDVSHLLHGPDQRDGGLGDPGDPGPILGLDEPVRHHP